MTLANIGRRLNSTQVLPEHPVYPDMADECPICHDSLPENTLGSHNAAAEAHVAACIGSRLSSLRLAPARRSIESQASSREEVECRNCHISLMSKEFASDAAREAHVTECIQWKSPIPQPPLLLSKESTLPGYYTPPSDTDDTPVPPTKAANLMMNSAGKVKVTVTHACLGSGSGIK